MTVMKTAFHRPVADHLHTRMGARHGHVRMQYA